MLLLIEISTNKKKEANTKLNYKYESKLLLVKKKIPSVWPFDTDYCVLLLFYKATL